MRILLYLLMASFLLCCKKQGSSVSAIADEWRWYKSISWGQTATPQSTGQTMMLDLNNNLSFFVAGTVFPAGTGYYNTTPDSLSFHYNNGQVRRFRYWMISHDTLVLDANSAVDFPIYYFVRQ